MSEMTPPTNENQSSVAEPAGDVVKEAPLLPPTVNTECTSPQPSSHKRSPKDFIFGKLIGEGSFSTVYLAKDIHTGKEYAIKVCDKRHIIKEKKTEYVKREKQVLNLLSGIDHLFVKLFCTFQDPERLYFVMLYAKNGELLPYINKVGSFDIECTKFYAAEILCGLEYMHRLGIIHRDLKPENILLDEKMHILITDFGCAKIIKKNIETKDGQDFKNDTTERKNSFVGTAQYVSPELLTDKASGPACDLWALGCIVYQMVSGLPPFRAGSEYAIFQKILRLEYEIPDGFSETARDLVSRLLVIDPEKRLGASDCSEIGYPSIRSHLLFKDLNFDTLLTQIPPPIYPYLPGTSEHEELRSHYRVPDHLEPGLDDKQLTRLLGLEISGSKCKSRPEIQSRHLVRKNCVIKGFSEAELKTRLQKQRIECPWHTFVQENVILKNGFVNKRKGLFSRKRMLLLTTGPHLYYVDAVTMVLKGEIPWSKELRVEPKNFKIFFVHTPNRTYYLDDPEGFALEWCQAIEEVRMYYYGSD